ncbi:serine hydrolase domain-containing protein [Microbulbifer taiwanensis]|uniref:Serine hydrolase domain-containing protein n=2 Tax=Microbulbifer taiwanensis TaxID=986746 RepID=A0ABW1YQG9_9GAMM
MAASDPQLLLREHVTERGAGTAIVAMLVDLEGGESQSHFYSYAIAGEQPPTANSLFEIGSVTKVFTSLLLADMVGRGEVTLETTVGEILPRDLPSEIASITLAELSQHTSGLPRLPVSLGTLFRGLIRAADPYAGLTREDLFQALQATRLNDHGEFAYSNLGVALLGQLLAERVGQDFPSLLRTRVLQPRGLEDIRLDFSDAPRERLLQGHRRNGLPTPWWSMGAYSPAGSLVASARDLKQLLEQQMVESCPIWDYCTGGEKSAGLRLAWMENDFEGQQLVWHNGATGGFRSFVGFIPERRQGVVVLSNGAVPVEYLGAQLLGIGAAPAPQPGYLWIWFRGGILLLIPLSLFFHWWRGGEGRGVLLWCRLLFAGGWRWRRLRGGRAEYLAWLLVCVVLYTFIIALGAWETLPIWLAWVSAAVSVAILMRLLWRRGGRNKPAPISVDQKRQ